MAVALNEDTSQKVISKALHPDKGVGLILTSLKYLLHNPYMRKPYAYEEN